jgi:hypothetical protein
MMLNAFSKDIAREARTNETGHHTANGRRNAKKMGHSGGVQEFVLDDELCLT